MTNRLFLFAAYDAGGYIDPALVEYVRHLCTYGDIALYMDANAPDTELKKLSPYVIFARTTRHGEYDFGSYKRAYLHMRDAGLLQNYDIVYLVNDSVYAPVRPIGPVLEEMESGNFDLFGPVLNPHHDHPHIQSWFVGMRRDVFLSKWFDTFLSSVAPQPSKGMVTRVYEHGLSRLAAQHGARIGAIYSVSRRGIYNRILYLHRRGMPWIKRAAFIRHNGAFGRQLTRVLDDCTPGVRNAIMASACHVYGNEYIHWLLTKNPIKIMFRNIAYAMKKIKTGQI